MFADLHLHSTASDGRWQPVKLLTMAKSLGFTAIAITDHDTMAGFKEAQQSVAKEGVELIAGVELSTLYHNREIHILGYYVDGDNKALQMALQTLTRSRKTRAEKIVQKLNAMGVGISWARVEEISQGESIGRPHIARAMVEKNVIGHEKHAFSSKYLGRGGAAYVERFRLTPQEAIDLIKNAGGIAVVAHPGLGAYTQQLRSEDIEGFMEMGLEGIEVLHSEHDTRQTAYYSAVAERLGLLVTGGSDFHGTSGSVRTFGCIKLPYTCVEKLKAAYIAKQ